MPSCLYGQTGLDDATKQIVKDFMLVLADPNTEDALTKTKKAEECLLKLDRITDAERQLLKISIGEIYVRQKEYDEAFRMLELIKQESISDSSLIIRSGTLATWIGMFLFHKENYEKSSECFEYAIHHELDNGGVSLQLTNLLFQIDAMCKTKNKAAISKLQELFLIFTESQSNTLRNKRQPAEYADGMRNGMNNILVLMLSYVYSTFRDTESVEICFNILQYLNRFAFFQVKNQHADIKKELVLDYKRLISEHLDTDEVAIAFAPSKGILNSKYTKGITYVAYIIDNTGHIDFVDVCSKKDIEPLLNGDSIWNLYSDHDSTLREMVWSKIEPYTSGKRKIFITPCGILNRINFLHFNDSVYELSALHDLAKHKNVTPTKSNALLIGGLNYDEIPDKVRGKRKWGTLSRTKQEIDSISLYLSPSHAVTKLSYDNATKNIVKGICREPVEILHFATHAFCFTDSTERSKLQYYQSQQYIYPEKRELTYSGLVLSMGNKLLNKDVDKSNDGILFADEIAKLDLSNTQLVVLSACDSGLGVYDDIEGCLGLLSSFKLAGANNIIASLFEVEDDAACEFMITFYQLLASTNDIHSSFLRTISYMKNKYPDDPRYWSMFKLVQ